MDIMRMTDSGRVIKTALESRGLVVHVELAHCATGDYVFAYATAHRMVFGTGSGNTADQALAALRYCHEADV